jgi:hypothetical protein
LRIIGTEYYGKKKLDSEGESEAKMRTEISVDSSILKKRNQKSVIAKNGKFIKNGNPHHVTVHLHVFIDVVFGPEDLELTIETLDYLDTYFDKWFMHVCYRAQQDQVGKDPNTVYALYGSLGLMIIGGAS